MNKTWIPLLSCEHKLWLKARDAITSISESIEAETYGVGPTSTMRQRRRFEDSLLFAYLATALNEDRWFDATAERLNSSIDLAPEFVGMPGLYGGLCGL